MGRYPTISVWGCDLPCLRYANCSIVTPNHFRNLCSVGHMAHSIGDGYFANFYSLLFSGINPAGFSGHSFHRGAANSAFKREFREQASKRWGGGKTTLLIDTFQLLLITPYCSPSPNCSTLGLARQALHSPLFLHDQRITNLDDGSPFSETPEACVDGTGACAAMRAFPL